MIELRALKDFKCYGAPVKAGDTFKCKDKDAPFIISQQLAEGLETKSATTYQTRHMEADFVPYMPPKNSKGDSVLTNKTVAELRAEAEAKGIHLPSGYITKSELLDIIGKA